MATWPDQKDAFPYIELAKYHEHRLKNWEAAIVYVDQALERTPTHQPREVEVLLHRKRRLEEKKASNATR
jgi:hypothetical protein